MTRSWGFALMVCVAIATGATASTKSVNGIGYTATNNVDYDWIDISATGMKILDDNYSWDRAYVPMEFSFSLYGSSCPGIEIGAGGFLVPSYGLMTTPWAPLGGVDNLRNCNQNGLTIISPWFDTLTTHSSQSSAPTSAVYYQTTGSPGSRQMIVQWQDVDHDGDSWPGGNSGAVTFQAILYEGTNEIKFQYKDVTFENRPDLSGAQNGAIGITDGGARLVQWSSGQSSIQNESAILLAPKKVNNPLDASVTISPGVNLSVHGHAMASIMYTPEPTEWDPYPMPVTMSSGGSPYQYTQNGWNCATVCASVMYGDAHAEAMGLLEYKTDCGSDGATAYFCLRTDGHEWAWSNSGPNWWGMADAHLWLEGTIAGDVSVMGPEGVEMTLFRTEYDADGIAAGTTSLAPSYGGKVCLDTPYTTNGWFLNGQSYYYVEYTVPEPAAISLLALGVLATMRRRKT